MKKIAKFILAIGCLFFAFAGAACNETKVDEYQEKGYTVSVTFDGNGGNFLGRPGIKIMDLFNPNDYQSTADPDGTVHIKLTEPTDPDRVTGPSNGDTITLARANYSLVGWYQTRTVKMVGGKPVDENGRALKQLENGSYVYETLKTGETETVVTPAYSYADPWNFETDMLSYNASEGKKNLTLYAGWVPYYEFHYYYENNGQWVQFEQVTTFDYQAAKTNPNLDDLDTIWLPQWGANGAMDYSYSYKNGRQFNFPQLTKTTFLAAYTDEECTNQIQTPTFEHSGTLNYENCTYENPIQDIYIKVLEGNRYHITNAQQIADTADTEGYYEICNDLDFTGVTWPAAFSLNTFSGKMYGANGQTVTISNVTVKHTSQSRMGGMFGEVGASAELKNLQFQNATFDLVSAGNRTRNTQFGLFAGTINAQADISNVSVGGTFKVGNIAIDANTASLNLYANGDISKLTKNDVKLVVYGREAGEDEHGNKKYLYTVYPHEVGNEAGKTVTVDTATYQISLSISSAKNFTNESYEINWR